MILEDLVHVTVIAVYRYVIVVHRRHLGVMLTRRRSVVAILAFMYFIPPLYVLIKYRARLTQAGGSYHDIKFCSFAQDSEFQQFGVVKKHGVVSLCAAIIGFCYVRIYWLVRRRGHRLNVNGGSSNQVRLRRELSLLKTAVWVFLTFIASYLPINLVYGLDTGRQFPDEIYFVASVCLWLSPSINWIVYGTMNAKFAQAYRHLLCAGKKTSATGRRQRRSRRWLSIKPMVGKAMCYEDIPCRRVPMISGTILRSLHRSKHASKV